MLAIVNADPHFEYVEVGAESSSADATVLNENGLLDAFNTNAYNLPPSRTISPCLSSESVRVHLDAHPKVNETNYFFSYFTSVLFEHFLAYN